MLEMYRSINAKTVTSEYLLIDHTKNRTTNFDIYFSLSVGLLLIIEILSYNRQELSEFILTVTLLIIVILFNLFKIKLCHKSVLFNREKGTIHVQRTLPKLNKTYYFSTTEITAKNKTLHSNNSTHTYRYKTYSLNIKHTDKKVKICESSNTTNFDSFIKNYMSSDKKTLDNLISYNKEDDLELNKKFHL